jgi:hypothetical protein
MFCPGAAEPAESRMSQPWGDAPDAMAGWLQVLLGVDKAAALAYASTCVDMRIAQVAKPNLGGSRHLAKWRSRRSP